MILWEPKEQIARWVFAQMRDGTVGEHFYTQPYIAMGFTDQAGRIAGGVVYYNFVGDAVQVAASGTPGWLTRQRVEAMFAFPFEGLKRNVIMSFAAKANKRARQFNERLGFQECGKVPKATNGKDAIMFAMTKDECRWLRGYANGKT